MLTVYPDYYPAFRCIAGACRHSCCIGWEIDIDEESLARYKAMHDPLGERLRRNISADDPPHFVLGERERCPFLNERNLCDLILEGGEGLLCQICDDHPRFRNFLPGYTEIGLGLCCEGAAQLILSQQEPVQLLSEGNWEEKDPDAEALLALRKQAFAIVQDRSLSIDKRMDKLLLLCQACEPGHPADWVDVFLELERLDEGWTAMLQKLEQDGKTIPVPDVPDVQWEQLLVYFLYRHFLTAWEDGDVGSKAGFAVLSVRLLRCLKGLFPQVELAELARMYSAEIEYSNENMDILFDELL
ncbi:MAG: flagellin lysine-N-methylase [Clostridia bacterium]|nr:flagellin lysine-N-methylase [Clostridia bacterium]